MLIKIGDTVYDPNEQPISIYLTDQDKQNIVNMHPEAHYMTACQVGIGRESLDQWINEFKDFVAQSEQPSES